MKRIIAAMLILTLCVTTAFATRSPGSEIIFADDAIEWGATAPDNELSTTYYSIAGQTWTSGKDLVASVRIDNEDNTVVLKLKPDYTSTKEKDLKGTIKVRDKKKGRFLELTINDTVGYTQGTIDIESDGNIPTLTVDQDTVYTVVASDKGYPYGTLMFQADVADVTARVYDKEKYYLGFTRDPNKDILKANAESDAVIEFLNFEGTPTFSSTATINFYGFEDNHHIYELKNGKLVKTTAKWDNDTDSYVIKTRTLGSYVISDKTLRGATSGSTGDNTDTPDNEVDGVNPDTGANDVAGIAMALAVVSLVSAAAISLKKN